MRLDPVLANNLLLQGELVRLARGLQAANVDFIVLKGVVLLQRIYGRLDARPVSDNDLLFRASDLPQALLALESLGYEAKPQAALHDAIEGDAKYVLVREHFGRDLWLDVHTSALVPTIHVGPEHLFWGHTECYVINGTSMRVFSPELTLLHLIAHAEQHRFCEPRILRDVAAAWNTWMSNEQPAIEPRLDAARLLGLAAKFHLQHALDYVLGSADALGLLTAAPPFVGSRRARRLRRVLAPERLLVPAERNGAEAYFRATASLLLRDPSKVLAQLHKDLLPPLSKLAVIHDSPPGPLLYLHYATRPFRPLARLAGWQPPPPTGTPK